FDLSALVVRECGGVERDTRAEEILLEHSFARNMWKARDDALNFLDSVCHAPEFSRTSGGGKHINPDERRGGGGPAHLPTPRPPGSELQRSCRTLHRPGRGGPRKAPGHTPPGPTEVRR